MKLFRLQDAVQIVGNEKSAKDLLRNYRKQQLICQIRRNLYTVTDLATKQALSTKFEIGSNITPSACLSYHSALEYHGLAHQQFFVIYVSSSQKFTPFDFEGIHYHYCNRKSIDEKGVYSPPMDSLVRVTDEERTLIDCIDRIDRAGGLEELLNAMAAMTYLNENKLLTYLEIYNKQFLYQKAGFLLSYFQRETKVSDNFVEICREKMGKSTRYLDGLNIPTVYHSQWKLFAPENIRFYSGQDQNEFIQ
ncbi:MAG: type IV toxin-antitoxin system AbiEi family antitoxin [Phycisphaerales bacterium]